MLIELAELLERQRCPQCLNTYGRKPKSKPVAEDSYFTRDLPCDRCGALPWEEGMIGEELNRPGVLVDEDGYARPYLPGRTGRLPGESIHRAHRCGSVRLA